MAADVKLPANATDILVTGVLNVDTVIQLRAAGSQLAKTLSEPVFNLQNVTDCDSAALALLTAWARDAKKLSKVVRFTHVPTQLVNIARLCGLDQVLVLN